MKRGLIACCLIALVLATGYSIKVRQSETGKTEAMLAVQYIERYKDIAMSEMRRTKIPASIILAQGIIESKSGKSYLAVKAQNHFGIKCHKGWTGRQVFASDDEERDCFRKYNSVKDSFTDHSDFLINHRRYDDLFRLNSTDYVLWSKGLQEAGYATEPTYARQLIHTIETHHLDRFDRQANLPEGDCAENFVLTPMSFNGMKTVFFNCKITPEQIAQICGAELEKIIRLNGFNKKDTIPPRTIVYLPSDQYPSSGIKKQEAGKKEEINFLHTVARMYGLAFEHRNPANESE
ncbi:MAG: glucosaminidase domain-containing protein [Sphingobacteriales bacterium]|nr:MAG: glucosaminidase domain-containing protein [Sphingobacteriales bacterium]